MRVSTLFCSLTSLAWLAACGSSSTTPPSDAGRADSGVDVGEPPPPDTGVDIDSGTVEEDAGPDAGGDSGTDGGTPIDIRIPGLTAPVTVDFDEHAITHINCATDQDCYAAQGYMHAAHRFGQMDLRRRFARGTLGEVFGVFGETVFAIDRQARVFIATRDGNRLEERLWASANAETQEAIRSYTRGVNAWVADLRARRNGARITAEWPLSPGLAADWDVLDTAACILSLLEDLTNDSSTEIDRGALAAALPPAQFSDLFGLKPASNATILPRKTLRSGGGSSSSGVDSIAAARVRLADVYTFLMAAREGMIDSASLLGFGSNNWIVSPSQTTDQKALLANDPHLGLENPPIWYVNSMYATDGSLHVGGLSFVGLPSVILGQNEKIAWGATTTFFDQADVYVETLTSSAAVSHMGGSTNMIGRDLVFNRQVVGQVIERHYYVAHHGPVIAFDRPNNRAISVRWAGHDADTDLNFVIAMAKARSMAEAKVALRNVTATGQNFIVADVDGNIGWFPYSRVPVRPWAAMYPPFLPLPGTGEAEWQGYYDYDELPQSENPGAGYLATANGDMTGELQDGDPSNGGRYLQHFVADGYRQERILQRLSEDSGQHSLETMQSIQADVRSLYGENLVPAVLAIVATSTAIDANGTLVVQALTDWMFECPTGLVGIEPDSANDPDPINTSNSAGCMAFHALLGRLNRAAFDDEISAAGLNRHARMDSLSHLLTRPGELAGSNDYWDDVRTAGVVETAQSIVTRTLNSTGEYLITELGPTIQDWRWGKKHTLALEAGFVDNLVIGPYANDGGLSTVDVANPSGLHSDNYAHTSGPSMRWACEANVADGVDCTVELPGGQRTFPTSPFYSDLHMKWLVNEPYPLWFDPSDVRTNSREQVIVRPAP